MYYKDRVDTHVAVVVMYKYSKSICIYLLSEMFNSPADGGCNISRLSVSNFQMSLLNQIQCQFNRNVSILNVVRFIFENQIIIF